MRTLYGLLIAGTLRPSARSGRVVAAATTDGMVGSVQGLLRSSRTARVVAPVLDGLLGDSARKSMSAMLARVSEPTSYQAFQHFITHAPWDATVLWRRLRAVMPERTGILILDETSFPKSGPHSVGAARQYCGALGKVANCQVAVTAALWTGQRAWPMGALLYLPEAWISDLARRATARIPATVVFQEKWRLALTLVRLTRAAGVTLTAVVADAEYGDNSTVRQALHRLRLPYALGISPTLTVFRGTPTLRVDRTQPPPRNRRGGWPTQDAVSVRAISDALRPRRGTGSSGATGPMRRGPPISRPCA